jgi:hypothetical protein
MRKEELPIDITLPPVSFCWTVPLIYHFSELDFFPAQLICNVFGRPDDSLERYLPQGQQSKKE